MPFDDRSELQKEPAGDIRPLEQIEIILEDSRRAAEAGPRLLAHVPVDVGNGHHVAVQSGLVGNDRPLISHADGADTEAFDFMPRLLLSGGRLRNDCHACRQCGGGKKRPATN
ncbi:MAG TPA: hypothetical protein VNH11_27165 [Pirellulales bacterium]|nr:hypothetical protein [Pirellulales bacterium]